MVHAAEDRSVSASSAGAGSASSAGAGPPAAEGGARLDPERLDAFLRVALAEDRGPGDLTSEGLLPPERRARGRLVAKASGIAAGLGVFARVFQILDPSARVELARQDGAPLEPGDVAAHVEGSAPALLIGERTALNLVQRMCGIATLTKRFVDAAGGGARILDTRKTTPGLRFLEKYAVRCGGGENHRFGLFDEAMIKNNHVDVAGRSPAELVRELRARYGERLVIHAEARDEAEALAAIEGGADVVLLDNMDAATLSALVPRLRAAAEGLERTSVELEASGGIDLSTVAAMASTGVDRLSVGALTHSATALDLSFAIEALA